MSDGVSYARDDQSLGQLFADLARETTTLVRQEIALAKSEFQQKVADLGKDAGMIAAGVALAYAGLLAIIAAVVLLLTRAGMDPWASALLVGILILGGGSLLVWQGIYALRHQDLSPRQTLETLEENKEWMKEQTGQQASLR
jgi:hypothetical protein